ncbi:CRISPR-associated endoribonuclease Cas6 [Thermococcus sp. SY098]|uniref:CRISPR-associated endoribonuclease Cas6 n=1 Tax=Thermococcus sp. SY098 TaxID=3111325 RepID=UPI002D799E18|nr:CRISPR-associated endoribonuclease Cas6 [Thermococcus sp. SY098]WRS52695.1 CRISPR-associated endoribonuclease Cas6 [Thermococcus sp. SY098]
MIALRFKLILVRDKPFILPFNYPRSLYGFTLKVIETADSHIAWRLHNIKKDIKFVLSEPRAIGKRGKQWTVAEKGILVKSKKFKLYFSTAEPAIANAFAEGINQLEEVKLFDMHFYVEEIRLLKEPNSLSGKPLKTLSPINIIDNNPPNGKRQWDVSPFQSKNSPYKNEPLVWKYLLFKNLRSKYLMLHGETYEGSFDIEILNKPRPKEKRLIADRDKKTGKPIWAIAWHLGLKLYGEEDLLSVAYQLGIGVRNTHGFGMIEIQ